MTRRANGEDWTVRLARWLIEAGLAGKKTREIQFYLRGDALATEIQAQLDDWWEDRKVDKYELQTKGRPAMVWRATTEMLKDE